MRTARAVLSVAGISALALVVFGHTENLITTGATTAPLTWPPGGTVTYRLNNQIAPGMANMAAGSNPVLAIQTAFQTIGTASGLNFVDGGTTSTTTVGSDGVNLVTFANTAANAAAVGGAIAVAVFTFNPATFRITEADIIFNPAQSFSTTGTATAQDVQAIAAHEIGHAVGMTHSPMLHATMFPFVAPGNTALRQLSDDDRSGLRTLYPGTSAPSFATVTGIVRRSATQLVFGAHVVLRDIPTGRSITAGVSLANGAFSVGSVPPGVYQLYVEPLDGPFPAASLSGGIWNSGAFDTTFRTLFLGGNSAPTAIVARAGQTTNVGVITVAGPAPALNVTGASLTTIPNGFASYAGLAQSAVPGSSQFIAIGGPGFQSLPDSAFAINSAFVTLGGASTVSGTLAPSGDGFKIFPLSIAANAPPGGYDIRITNTATGEISIFAGGVDVQPIAAPLPYTAGFFSPCGGSGGAVALTAVGAPSLGNAAFGLSMANTVLNRTAYFLLTLRPDALPALPGCTVAVDLATLIIPFPGISFLTLAGTTFVPTPIPAQANLAGNDVFVQLAITDPGSPFSLALTNGILVHMQ